MIEKFTQTQRTIFWVVPHHPHTQTPHPCHCTPTQKHRRSLSHTCTNTPRISAQSDLISLSPFFCTTVFDLWCAMHCINYVSCLSTNVANTFKFVTGAGSSQRPRGWLQEAYAYIPPLRYAPHKGKCKACIWAIPPFQSVPKKGHFSPSWNMFLVHVWMLRGRRSTQGRCDMNPLALHRYGTENNNRGMI